MNHNSQLNGQEVAVIGISGRFPGASDVRQYWDNISGGKESISFASDQELMALGIDKKLLSNEKYIKVKGGLLDDWDRFDAAFFGFTPTEAALMDPQTRLFLECAWNAMENAGYNVDHIHRQVGVYAGAGSHHNWEIHSFQSDQSRQAGVLATTCLADKDFMCTRVSHQLNLKGPSVNVQASCATSLVAVHMACQALLDGECDMALAGGVSVYSQDKTGYLDQGDSYFSSDGHLRAFDAKASGTVSGEGVGVVVLKPLEDALRDKDHIYAVVKGSAVNNDGRHKANYSAPSVTGQKHAIQQALAFAQVPPDSIRYVECHGTGTLLGDPIEVEALKQAFNGTKKGNCALGSVKSNIGHLNGAAGIAGFIKTVLALDHRMLPPSINFNQPNPAIDFDSSPFFINTQLTKWESDHYPLRAGVSAFGIGGNNAHMILEQAPQIKPASSTRREHQLITVSAKTPRCLSAYIDNLSEALKEEDSNVLEDIAFSFNSGRKAFTHRVGITGKTTAEIGAKLAALSDENFRRLNDDQLDRPVVFMFSGQGSEYVNMGVGLYRSEPVFKDHLDECFTALESLMGEDIRTVLYPPDGSEPEKSRVNDPLYAGPIKFSFEYALARMLMSWGVVPKAMLGHSLGEYVCACISGVMTLEDALALVVLRNRLMDQTSEGAMMSVPLPENEILGMLDDQVALAAVNTPYNSILSGRQERLDAIAAQLQAQGVDSIRFNVKRAGHSMLMDTILEDFETAVGKITLAPPQIPYISGTSGSWITDAEATAPGYYARHIRNTIRYSDGLAELLKLENAVFIQVGADRGPVVFVENQPEFSSKNSALNLVRHRKNDIGDEQFLIEALGTLWESGISLDWKAYYGANEHHRLPLPTYPFEGQRFPLLNADNDGRGGPVHLSTLAADHRQGNQIYAPSWRRKERAPRVPAQDEKKTVLLIMDSNGLGRYLAHKMTLEGHTVIELHAGETYAHMARNVFGIKIDAKAHYFKALEAIKKEYGEIPHIVHAGCFGIEDRNNAATRLEDLSNHGIYSLLYLVQGLGYLDINNPIQLDVVTNNMHEVIGGELTCPEKATLSGAINVIESEYQNITCRNIDIDLAGLDGKDRPEMLHHRIFQELESSSEEKLVALRGLFRWIRTFETTRLAAEQEVKPNPAPIKAEGVYLIIGGLGRIGLHIAHMLAETPGVKIVMLQRTLLPDKKNWQSYLSTADEDDDVGRKIRNLIALEEIGAEVMPISADVSDPDQLQAAVLSAQKAYGNINGVFNCAMDPGGGLIQNREKQEIEAVLAAKVQGTLTLDHLLKDQALDFFVLFSSLSAVLPVMGKIDYCSANAFLDAFAHHPDNRQQVRYMAINWNYWEGTPLDDAPETAALIRKNSVSPQEGIEILKRLLQDPRPQILVSCRHPLAYAQELRKTAWSHYADTTLASEPARNLLENYRKVVPFLAPRTPAEKTLINIWKTFFGYQEIGVADDFFQLGGDSLKALHIIPKVNAEFGGSITIANFYRYPTVADMAAYIASGGKNEYRVFGRLSTNTADNRNSLICLPYAAGGSFTYMEFAQIMETLNPTVSVYAVNYPGNELDGSSWEQKDFEEVITQCVGIIKREVKPPIAVYGHCVGSYLALDLCARLEREDIKVNFLGIGGILNRPVLDVDEFLNYDDSRMREVYRKLGTFKGRDEEVPRTEYNGISKNFKEDSFRIANHMIRLQSEGLAPRLSAPIINLISDTDETTDGYTRDYQLWREYSDTVRLVEVSGGGHFFINQEIQQTATIVNRLIEEFCR